MYTDLAKWILTYISNNTSKNARVSLYNNLKSWLRRTWPVMICNRNNYNFKDLRQMYGARVPTWSPMLDSNPAFSACKLHVVSPWSNNEQQFSIECSRKHTTNHCVKSESQEHFAVKHILWQKPKLGMVFLRPSSIPGFWTADFGRRPCLRFGRPFAGVIWWGIRNTPLMDIV